MSDEDYVEVPPDSTGKKLRALKRNVGGNDVYDEVVAVEDGSGNIIDPRKNVEVTGIVVVGASALPTGAATESTLGSVKAKTDNLDTPLSGVKSKTDNIPADPAREGGNLASIAGKDFATQTTLALVKAKTDNVDVSLSTRALEAGGNLAAIKAKTDNLDVALSARTLTKHDNKTYLTKVGRINATALLSIAIANKIIKVHCYSASSESDGQTVYFYEETSGTQLSQKWPWNAREGVSKPFAPAPAQLFKTVTAGKDLGLNLANATYVNYEIVYSVDDAA